MPEIQIPESLITALRASPRVAVLTGAGVSAESGIPTFREAQTGLWAQFRPEDLASPQAFEADPQRVWEWYSWRRDLVSRAAPNPAHLALSEMQRLLPTLVLITQNVDGLHQRAGSAGVVELHGNLARVRCSREGLPVKTWENDGPVPRCPSCGAYLRPDVVWFGEMLPAAALETAMQAARTCDWFFSIGTSGVVEPAASLAYEALRRGARLVEINLQPTPLSLHAAHLFQAPAGQILPLLLRSTWPEA